MRCITIGLDAIGGLIQQRVAMSFLDWSLASGCLAFPIESFFYGINDVPEEKGGNDDDQGDYYDDIKDTPILRDMQTGQ